MWNVRRTERRQMTHWYTCSCVVLLLRHKQHDLVWRLWQSIISTTHTSTHFHKRVHADPITYLPSFLFRGASLRLFSTVSCAETRTPKAGSSNRKRRRQRHRGREDEQTRELCKITMTEREKEQQRESMFKSVIILIQFEISHLYWRATDINAIHSLFVSGLYGVSEVSFRKDISCNNLSTGFSKFGLYVI